MDKKDHVFCLIESALSDMKFALVQHTRGFRPSAFY